MAVLTVGPVQVGPVRVVPGPKVTVMAAVQGGRAEVPAAGATDKKDLKR